MPKKASSSQRFSVEVKTGGYRCDKRTGSISTQNAVKRNKSRSK